ncbi:MAG: M28 family metallopeptidase [Acidimicrobiia bacterium]|nr:M28 family metallopeptidase [Acidimicrobiia bacterium]
MIKRVLLASALVCGTIVLAAPAASAGPQSCEKRSNNNLDKLLECVTVDNVRAHQQAFQDAADANGGTREASTPGYAASGAYVAEQMEAAGYDVIIQDFQFPFFQEHSMAELQQVTPTPTDYPYFDAFGFATMDYSGSGDVTATAQGVDLVIPAAPDANTSTSGCEAADFAGFGAGNIAIVQRGSCDFVVKAVNAEAAGAVGVVIFNEGQPGRTFAFLGTLGGPDVEIPVVAAHYDVGVELAAGGVEVRMFTDTTSELRDTFNVIAESEKGNPDNVVMVGAHLDSVAEGPGIQDNGSGSAAILETAIQMQQVHPRNQVRFAWWGAEESGLLGSEYYVDNLTEDALDDITLYLNFDMIGSPNYMFAIYDGDDSDMVGAGPGPEGSAQIEKTFEDYYDSIGEPYQGTDFSGRSDYGPFIAVGIPAGGLFTGAEGIKTTDEAALYGGTAGDPYDPCYHLACDTFDNISLHALDVNSDAVAHATLSYAMSTELINGDKSKGNFKPDTGVAGS